MHALMIDPLRIIADCEFVICKMFSPLYRNKISQSVQLKRQRSAE
jgi:hypothetical protein